MCKDQKLDQLNNVNYVNSRNYSDYTGCADAIQINTFLIW